VHHLSQAISVQFVNKEFGAGGRFKRLIAGRVVGMTVGVNDVGYPVLQPFSFGQNAIRVKCRIYQGAGFSVFIANQVTEYGHPGQPYLLNIHSLVLFSILTVIFLHYVAKPFITKTRKIKFRAFPISCFRD
jgi:hypothetical protein